MGNNREQKQIEIIIKGGQANASLREIQSASRVLNAELKKLPVNSKEFADKSKQLKDVNARLKSINDDVRNVGNAFKGAQPHINSFSSTLKGMLGADLIMRGVGMIKDFATSSIKSFTEAEVNAKKLEFALTNISGEGKGALDRLIKQSEDLQDKGIFSDDDIQVAQTALAQYGLTSKQIEKLIPQILDLAAAQGIDLASATDKVVSAISGQTRGLKDAGIAFEDTGSKTENLAILTEKLTKFQGANSAALETTTGKVQRLENAWDNIKEAIGEYLVTAGNDLLDFYDVLAGKMTIAENATKKMSEIIGKSLDDQNAKVRDKAEESEKNRLIAIKITEEKIAKLKEQGLANQDVNQKRVILSMINNQQLFLQELNKMANERTKISDDATKKGIGAEESAAKKMKAAREKLLKDIAALEMEFYEKGLEADTKEVKDVHDKYQKLLDETKDFEQENLRIKKLYQKELEYVLQKQAAAEYKAQAERLKKKQDVEDKIYLETLNAKDKELVVEMQKWDALILEAEQYGIDATALRVAQGQAIAAIVDKQNQEALDKEKSQNEKDLALKKQKIEAAIVLFNEFYGRLSSIADSYLAIQRANDDKDLQQNAEVLQNKQYENEQLLRAKLIDEKEYNKRQLAAQKEHDMREKAIKKEQYEREQQAAISKALINGALGITQIWATYAANPIIAGALTAIEAAAIAFELGVINSAPKPYAMGGFNDDPSGYVSNATLFTNSASGKPFIAGEAGKEWISPSWMLADPQTANIIHSLENYRKTKTFATGGYSSTATASPSFASASSSGVNISEAAAVNLTNAINRMCNEGIAAYLDYDRYTRTLDKIEGAKTAARVG